MSAIMEKLKAKEQTKRQAQGRQIWKPKEGETIHGTIMEIGTMNTPYGEAEYCLLREDDGKTWTVFLNKVLKDQFEADFVIEGTRVVIKFLGFKTSKKGSRKYKDYIVIVDDITVPLDAEEDDNIVDVDETIEE